MLNYFKPANWSGYGQCNRWKDSETWYASFYFPSFERTHNLPTSINHDNIKCRVTRSDTGKTEKLELTRKWNRYIGHIMEVDKSVKTLNIELVAGGHITNMSFSPKGKRPKQSLETWWENRKLPKQSFVEQLSDNFDNRLWFDNNFWQKHQQPAPKEKEHQQYKGPTPSEVLVDSIPGGFSIMWEWPEDSRPLVNPTWWDPHTYKGMDKRRNWLRPQQVAIWHRPTAWRGTGQPWWCSSEKAHVNPYGNRLVNIPTPGLEGHLVDIMIQGRCKTFKFLPPTKVFTVYVEKNAPVNNKEISFTTMMYYQDYHPEYNKPLTLEEYNELKEKYKHKVSTSEINNLKFNIIGSAKVLSTQEMRNLCREALPNFQMLTDNAGKFHALPLDVWNDVIDITMTDTLHYDPVWFSCADFTSDFRSAAARLGAKSLMIWDYDAQHAYCCLPMLKNDGTVTLQMFEPQTDEYVEPNEDGRGYILAW